MKEKIIESENPENKKKKYTLTYSAAIEKYKTQLKWEVNG